MSATFLLGQKRLIKAIKLKSFSFDLNTFRLLISNQEKRYCTISLNEKNIKLPIFTTKLTDSIKKILPVIREKYEEINKQIIISKDPTTKKYIYLTKQKSKLESPFLLNEKRNELLSSIEELCKMVKENSQDKSLVSMVIDNYNEILNELQNVEADITRFFLKKDVDDVKNAVLEIRAGTGGTEASLFAREVLDMYRNYAEIKGWSFEVVDETESDLGGVKDVSAFVRGADVFKFLRYECGGHRVQRIPKTEAQHRIHTSTVTVAVLPEPTKTEVIINQKDLKIETMRSGGSGGQNVNKVETAVRITHLPTGLWVKSQVERSQHLNKELAMELLRHRLYESQRLKYNQNRIDMRKELTGSGSRDDRIRTYNYPQDRITDHQINSTMYGIQDFMSGNGLCKMIDSIVVEKQQYEVEEYILGNNKE